MENGNSFFKFLPKNTQISQFWPKINIFLLNVELLRAISVLIFFLKQQFFFFNKIQLCISTNSKVLIANVTIVFQIYPNTLIRRFWSKIWSFFVLRETLHFDKFEGADFEYDHRFFKLLLIIPKEGIFWFHK